MLVKELLLSQSVQDFIRKHEHEDPNNILLRQKSIDGVSASTIAQQLNGLQKAKDKLPIYYTTPRIIFPASINLEQSSSQATAVFKTDFLNQQSIGQYKSCADLTGGFGVDSFFFSRIFAHVNYVDPDQTILDIARHNHEQLGARIQHHYTTAESFLQSTTTEFDFIFIDPSRRIQGSKKVSLSESEPNVIQLQNVLLKRARHILIKASPLLDINLSLKELRGIKIVVVLSVENECRELLFFLERDYAGEPAIQAVNILSDKSVDRFDFTISQEKNARVDFVEPRLYLYEPNASVMKAGAFKSIASAYGVSKIHPSTHLYTSDILVENFPGRIFRIEGFVKPDPKVTASFFLDKKANVFTRNYPLSVDELRKKSGLIDGGPKYLIGFTGILKKYLAVAERVYLDRV